MTGKKKPKRRVRRLAILAGLVGAAFGYRRYRLSNAPEPSWDNPV